ncbi:MULTISPECIES: TolC family outer membrane protein [unclassified Rubrivivax]|uniref:TolC family outer membrane protein n=1 Tax=unclassified Rubrivivax TaxID=2649762 RepID=UPI0013E955AF|nr:MULTISPECIES: TolC family outer membrane protein [unclassified Rubrivivax]MCC9598259.1 TolC family outer membrane protein [Rubrivivax sp. JA1055]MCC9645485.1 TolC family outer membrane protein [Rubrivivax sp. JA1029]
MRPLLTRLALASAVAFALPAAVHAQSLSELYQAARAYDASYLAARAQADSAEYQVAQTRALNRPAAALNASATGSDSRPDGVERGTYNTARASIDASLPLFNRSNSVAIEQAERSLAATQAALEAAEQDLVVRVAQAYFDVLAAQDALATTRASKTAITEQLASAKRNFEVGTATITDTREAQARYDLVLAEEIAAENLLLTRRTALDTLVGRLGTDPKPLATPVVLPEPSPADPEQWVRSAQGDHPAIRRAQVAYDIARLETERARAGHLPTLDLVASAERQRVGGSSVALNNAGGATNTYSMGLQFKLPLYAGNATQNRVRETLLLEESSRNELESARRNVALNARTALFAVQSGIAQVRAYEAAEASSKLSLEATQLGYRVGVRVNLDVLDAQTQLYATQRDLARARYDVIVNTLRLRQAAGRLGLTDVESVNALLAR